MTTPRPPRGSRARPATTGPEGRPLRGARREDVLARFERAVQARDGEAGAHCVHELWMRGEIAMAVEAMLARLWERAAPTIPAWLPMRHVDWLPAAYDIAARFRAERRGRHCVYLVLLDCADCRPDPFGVYVGMTHYRPAERFDQHKAGIRAAGSVLRRGLEVLEGPTRHLAGISRTEAVRCEAALAAAFAEAGIFTRGGH